MDKVEIHINPRITVSPVIRVAFNINIKVWAKLWDSLVSVIKRMLPAQ